LNILYHFKDSTEEKNIRFFIENIFGFSPKNIHVYKLAFLHSSAAIEIQEGVRISNERLEYLGDAILSAVIADYVYKKFPLKDEGFLTEMRSKIVSRKRLNKLSEKLGMHQLLQTATAKGSFNKDVSGNAFEAFVGAIYIDKGFDFSKKIIIEKILSCHLDIDEIEIENNNFKSRLISWAQSVKKNIEFKVTQVSEDKRFKLYTVSLYLDGKVVSKGSDYSIKKAEQNAAENFLKENTLHEEDQV